MKTARVVKAGTDLINHSAKLQLSFGEDAKFDYNKFDNGFTVELPVIDVQLSAEEEHVYELICEMTNKRVGDQFVDSLNRFKMVDVLMMNAQIVKFEPDKVDPLTQEVLVPAHYA